MFSSDEQRDEKRKPKTVVERASKPNEQTKTVVVVRHYQPDPHVEEKAIRTLLAGKRERKEVIAELERDRDALLAHYERMAPEALDA